MNSANRTRMQIVALAIAASLALALTMLGGLTEVIAQSAEDPRAYITVQITNGDDTVSWSDPGNCSSDYNLYLAVTSPSNDAETSRTHLGSAASTSTEATMAIAYSHGGGLTSPNVEVELYCGEYDSSSGQNVLVASTELAFRYLNLREDTYSSAPLTALNLSNGTLSPSFSRGIYGYEVEVPSDERRLTVGPTVLSGYQVIYFKNPSWGVIFGCDIRGCHYSYGDRETTGIVLADADLGTPGFQIELDGGENRLGMGVNKGDVDAGTGSIYTLTVTVSNVPATGKPSIEGTVQVGQTLTTNTSGIADEDGLDDVEFSYQWVRVNEDATETEIANATGATYRLANADAEKTIRVRIDFVDDAGNEESLTSSPTATVTEATALSADATISALTLSGVYFGTFEPAVTSYTARVANSVAETTVSPTVNHSGASYVIKLGGTTDPDGTLSLAVGSNVITVEVTAEDGQATRTYTIAVTRLDAQTSISSDASLGGLSLSGMDLGTFSPSTTSYSVAVGNDVSQTTVTPTVAHSEAGYVIRLNGVTDSDGTLPVRVGDNVIAIEVTAEDGFTTQTYSVTVTRAEPPSTDASLKSLTINDYTHGPNSLVKGIAIMASFGNRVTEATVTPTVNHPGATYVIKVDGVVDDDGVIPLPEPEPERHTSSVRVTIEVTAEDGTSTRTFNLALIRRAPASNARLRTLELSGIDFGTFLPYKTDYAADVGASVTTTTVTPTLSDSEASYVIELGGVEDEDGTISLAEGANVVTVEVTAEDKETVSTYTVTLTRQDSSSAPTGLPVINGTAQVGETLTVDTSGISDPDGLTNAVFDYQWVANDGTTDSDIAGETGAAYLVKAEDFGKTIRVRVTFTDDAGGIERLTSRATSAVEVSEPPLKPNRPVATTSQDSVILTWDRPSINQDITGYVILRWDLDRQVSDGFVVIEEDTESADTTFTDENVEPGTRYLYRVKAMNPIGVSPGSRMRYVLTPDEQNQDPPPGQEEAGTGPWIGIDVAPSTIEHGTAGEVVVAIARLDAGGSYRFEFRIVDSNGDVAANCEILELSPFLPTFSYSIYSAASTTRPYTLELTIRKECPPGEYSLQVDWGKYRGDTGQVTRDFEVVSHSNSAATGTPAIGGPAQVGEILTADTSGISDADGLTNANFSYQWIVNDGTTDSDVAGATSSTYVVTTDDVGKTIKVRVSFTDDADNDEVLTSAATTAVAATVPSVPRTVEAVQGGTGELDVSWEEPESSGGASITGYTVQWKEAANSWDTAADVSQATTTDTSYTIGSLSLGVEYSVRVIATNSVGDGPPSVEVEETADAQTSQQQAATQNTPATGVPTISGTPEVGQTLSAETSGIDDADGLHNAVFAYQWIRSDGTTDTDISGATSSTYLLVSDDEGKTIKVLVSFTDDGGNDETLSSTATAAVEAALTAALQNVLSSHDGSTTYITVEVTQYYVLSTAGDETAFTKFAVTWNDTEDCASSYNAYLNVLPGNRPGHETPGSQFHLGSAASDGSQISRRLEDVRGPLEGFSVEVYCGTGESGRLLSTVLIPSLSSGLPKIGTYSTEPSLTGLTVSHGTIAVAPYPYPRPHQQYPHAFTVSDVENSDTRITVTATPKTGYAVEFYEGSENGVGAWLIYSPGPNGITGLSERCAPQFSDVLGKLPKLTDADLETPGFQVDLYDGDTYILIRVYPTAVCVIGDEYELDITRAEGPVSLVRPNRPATGGVAITNAYDRDRAHYENHGPYVGMTMSAYTENIRDRDGLTNPNFSYQWLADDAEISGASNATYQVTSSDLRKTLKLRVSFTDDRGDEETKTSSATDIVRRKNISAVGEPIIVGIAEVGQTLRADVSGISDPNGLTNATFIYEWVNGQGTPTDRDEYTLVEGDAALNGAFWLKVTYTDDDGHTTTLWSEPLGEVTNLNNAPTGVPVIRGTPQVGETLTTDTSGISDPDGMTNAVFEYQWFAGNVGTFDMATSTYTPVAADVGKPLTVRVIFTDDAGYEEWLTSAATAAVTAGVPGAPQSLAVERGGTGELVVSWEEPDSDGGSAVTGYTVQWKEATGNWDITVDVSEATTTDTSYTIGSLSLGTDYSVRVIATNSVGDGPPSVEVEETADAQTSQQQAATQNTPATGVPTISGTPEVGQTLSAETSGIDDADGLDNAVFAYQWIRSDGTTDTDISGATGSTYFLVSDDEGKTIKVRVSFTDDADNDETLSSAVTAAVEAALTAEMQNVPSSHDGSGRFTFRILFSEPVTAGFTALKQHAFEVSNATIKRAQRVNGRNDLRKFTVQPSSDSDVVLVLPATEDCADEGAICTSSGKRLSTRLEITVPGPAPANSEATGAPTITGTLEVGQTLTASTSGISDADGLTNATFSYQWLADDADISGATDSTYTLADTDEGRAIRVRVSFTDDRGNEQTLSSAETAAVEARPNSPATGAPTVTGAAQVGQTLTADTSGISDADGLSNATFAYQWLADDADIGGATGGTYTLTDTEEGRAIKVRVSFTDDEGNVETLTSAATGAVTPSGQQEQTPEPTDRPHGLRASVDAGTVVLNWNAPDDAGSVTMYRILRHRPEEGESEPLVYVDYTHSTATSYTDRAVEPGTLYAYSVQAADFLGYVGEASDPASIRVPGSNSPATGAPTITGTAQVGQTLSVDTSGIEDTDGLANASFSYQWLADDADIAGATGSTYTLGDVDRGKAIKVTVSFSDDGGNDETLTSVATVAVAAETIVIPSPSDVPDAPTDPEVYSLNDQWLHVHWSSSDAASTTWFKIQWKSGSEEFDSSREINLRNSMVYAIRASRSTSEIKRYSWPIRDLTDGTEYAVRVIAVNANGDSDPSEEATGTLRSYSGPQRFIEKEVIEFFESSQPWLRETWDYITSQNVAVSWAHPSLGGGRASFDCPDDQLEDNLRKCSATSVQIVGTNIYVIVHELAHVYTLANDVASVPGPVGIGHLYFDSLVSTHIDSISPTMRIICRPGELYAEALTILTLADTLGDAAIHESAYWKDCSLITDSVEGEALAAVGSTVSGEMPAWFADTYADSEGDPDLERIWLDVKGLRDSRVREALVFQLRNSFGGYCDNRKATESAFGSGTTRNPWRDGGCLPGAPTNLSVAGAGSGRLTVSWQEPLDDGGFPVEGYKVQWKSGNQEFSLTRQATTTETSHTIANLSDGVEYSVRISATNSAGDGPPSAEVEATPEAANTPATGAPKISGNLEVGQTLSANASDISDADGLTNATFSYQWLADDADISRATDSTYTLVEADEGKAIKVRVSFSDDGGNDETLTSSATAAVAAALTAEFLDAPSSHNGQTAFTFELRFSEEFDLSYVTLRDHAFTVNGGEVTKARRLDRDSTTPNIRWEITVSPSGNADVTIVLPVTEDCEDDGAICTEEGRMLSTRVELTVAGPGG